MTELQNDRMTDRTKTICPPIFDLGGIKIIHRHLGFIQGFRNETWFKSHYSCQVCCLAAHVAVCLTVTEEASSCPPVEGSFFRRHPRIPHCGNLLKLGISGLKLCGNHTYS